MSLRLFIIFNTVRSLFNLNRTRQFRSNTPNSCTTHLKKFLISLAKITHIPSALQIQIAISLTTAPAKPVIRTVYTIFRNISGATDKTNFSPFFIKYFQTILIKISQAILIQHIKITGIYTSIGFRHILKPTDSTLLTNLCLILAYVPFPALSCRCAL